MKPEDEIELQQRRLVDEVRDHVEKDLKRRYTWIGVIAFFITGGLITLIVRNTLFESKVKLEAAQQVQSLTTKRLEESVTASTKLTERTENKIRKFERTEKQAEERMRALASRASNLGEKLSDASKKNLLLSDELRQELSALTQLVKDVASEQDRSSTRAKEFDKRLAKIDQKLEKSGRKIEKAINQADLGRFNLSVRVLPGGNETANELRAKGYTINLIELEDIDLIELEDIKKVDYSYVLVSQDMPIAVARDVLSVARKYISPLNHLVSSSFGRTIVVGFVMPPDKQKQGKEITSEQFDKLLNESTSQKEFSEKLKLFTSFIWPPGP